MGSVTENKENVNISQFADITSFGKKAICQQIGTTQIHSGQELKRLVQAISEFASFISKFHGIHQSSKIIFCWNGKVQREIDNMNKLILKKSLSPKKLNSKLNLKLKKLMKLISLPNSMEMQENSQIIDLKSNDCADNYILLYSQLIEESNSLDDIELRNVIKSFIYPYVESAIGEVYAEMIVTKIINQTINDLILSISSIENLLATIEEAWYLF